MLAIFRVTDEPAPIGTCFLNGNLGFLLDALSDDPFRLGYSTLTGDADQPFAVFWEETVLPYLAACGYAVETALAVFGFVSTGLERYDLLLVEDVLPGVGAGLSAEALGILAEGPSGKV